MAALLEKVEVAEKVQEEQAPPQGPQKDVAPRETYGYLEHLVSHTKTSAMKPLQFFVSWSGVITLAYKGFSGPLAQLKKNINQSLLSLPTENPGSRWPKTSLGCLRDGVRLSQEQLKLLLKICREESGIFQYPTKPRAQGILVDNLTIAFYECRCLERQLSRRVIRMLPVVELTDPPKEEIENTEQVMSESEKPDYWFHASRDGNRESHYRNNALGVTMVHELACFQNPPTQGVGAASSNGGDDAPWQGMGAALPDIIRSFRRRVDLELPGLYAWFAEESLHITIRGLMG